MLSGAATTLSDLMPYLAVILLGFLIGGWGQASRAPLAVLIGIVLIMLAIVGFVIDNSSGDPGVPGF